MTHTIPELFSSQKPRRAIDAISAVLLPFRPDGEIDFDTFGTLIDRTIAAGITPAINMDTGYVNLLSESQWRQVLEFGSRRINGRFVAGIFVENRGGDPQVNYIEQTRAIAKLGGTPIVFPSTYTKRAGRDELRNLFKHIAESCDQFFGFELGEQFVPFGHMYRGETLNDLMDIPQAKGLKHSSLDRLLEFERIRFRDRVRPDFKIYTGNDLAIDMIKVGSDYLLGLSAFHPEAFAVRDRLWLAGDARFLSLNDLLQYLGFFAFRPSVPAYKHDAAMFLKLRGLISCDDPPPGAPRRPESDRDILSDILQRIDTYIESVNR